MSGSSSSKSGRRYPGNREGGANPKCRSEDHGSESRDASCWGIQCWQDFSSHASLHQPGILTPTWHFETKIYTIGMRPFALPVFSRWERASPCSRGQAAPTIRPFQCVGGITGKTRVTDVSVPPLVSLWLRLHPIQSECGYLNEGSGLCHTLHALAPTESGCRSR